ncbi:MAG: DUF2284 domain-containing protein [Eubacteriales bacterium]
MYDTEKFVGMAVEYGFTKACELNVASLVFRTEVRDMCAADRCSSYGKNWCCPPACGTIEDAAAMIKNYGYGIIVETVGQLEDEYDFDSMKSAGELHKQNFARLIGELRKTYPDLLAMGAGTCTLCEKCSCPDSPCRHPDERISSMEAWGLWVSDVCEKSGIPYNNGKCTVTYVSCWLLK